MLEDDAVFGVKESLIADFEQHDVSSLARKLGVSNPFRSVEANFVLVADAQK